MRSKQAQGAGTEAKAPQRQNMTYRPTYSLRDTIMKGWSTVQTPKIEPEQIQRVTHRAKHKFQWSRGVGTCACRGWTLWGASIDSTKRNWCLHFEESYLASIQRAAKRGPHDIAS